MENIVYNLETRKVLHGIRFDRISRLESILINKKVLPLNDIPNKYESIDGTTHYLNIFNYEDNCNHGKYISVTLYSKDSFEDMIYIDENIFLVFQGNIEVIKPIRVPYEKYLLHHNDKLIYSYSNIEYLVEDEFPLSKCIMIGINSSYYAGKDEDIEKIINLLRIYDIDIPFKDIGIGKILYQKEKSKTLSLNHIINR